MRRIILDEEYILKDRDIIKIRTNGLHIVRYVKDLDITQSFIPKTLTLQIEDIQRERYSIDDYMGFGSFFCFDINDLKLEKQRHYEGDFRSACDSVKLTDNKSGVEIYIYTNFDD